MSILVINISGNKYFNGLLTKYQDTKTKLTPYRNKRLDHSPFYRPYLCMNYQKKFKFIKVFPLSTYKAKDNLKATYFEYIVIGKRIVSKIVLSCPLIIPKNQTKIINVSKNSLTKCKQVYKEILIDLKNELQFCRKNYKFIIHAIKKYAKQNKKDKNKYPMLDEKINGDFNNQGTNKEVM